MTNSWRANLCLLLPVLLACAGCASNPPISEAPFPPGEPLVAPGTADLENIHLPSVMVSASIVTDRGRLARKLCSGVIVHPLPDGRVASHAQGGDSGGACVKGTDKNVLLGITTVGADNPLGGRMSVFTSVYSHRGWLLQMLEKANES